MTTDHQTDRSARGHRTPSGRWVRDDGQPTDDTTCTRSMRVEAYRDDAANATRRVPVPPDAPLAFRLAQLSEAHDRERRLWAWACFGCLLFGAILGALAVLAVRG